MIAKTPGESPSGRIYKKPSAYGSPAGKSKTGDKPAKDSLDTGRADGDWDKVPQFAQKYFTHGNKVTPLFDKSVTPGDLSDDIFANIEEVIRGAKKSVQVEMFSLDKKSLVNLLISEAKRGLKVQVIMDPPNEAGEADKKEAIEKLRKNGVNVLLYPAKEAGSKEAKYGQINHVKMLIVDGDKAIIGGMNWGEHASENHDVDVMVEGPAVDKMEWLFRKDWLESGGNQSDLPWIEKTPAHRNGNSSVNLLVTGLDQNERTIEKTIHRSIDNSKKSIHCELFVLTRGQTVDKLIAAHERGVDVRVVLNPLKIKGMAINDKAADKLRKSGVPVK